MIRALLWLPASIFFGFSVCASAQTITTIAGTGLSGFSGDSSLATLATLNNPFSLAVDNVGNVYFSDRHNNRVRKIFTSGTIVTIAGNGTAGYNGDGIAGTTAALNDPNGVAVDSSGIVYVADRLNYRIRKVSPAGIITTIAGNGTIGYTGDNAAATAATLSYPRGITVDAHGNIYIADQGNNCIRKIDPGGIITTIAGTGTGGYNGDGIAATAAQLFNPYGVAVDTSGAIYIADVDNSRIRKIATGGIISTIAGTGVSGFAGDGGPATGAQLSEPIGVAVDALGNVFIADDYNSRIREVNVSGTIGTIAGTATSGYNGDGILDTTAELNNPTGVAVSSTGFIYIADYNNNRIRYMPEPTAVSVISRDLSAILFPNPGSGMFTIGLSSSVTEEARICISDVTGKRIKELTMSTNKQTTIRLSADTGVYFIEVSAPSGKCCDKIVVVK